MRVLWFSNSGDYHSPNNVRNSYNGGGWISALQKEIVKKSNISLGICFVADNEPEKIEQESYVYYPIANHVRTFAQKVFDLFHPNDLKSDKRFWNYYIESFKKVITDYKPDVIEVFGTEVYFQLAAISAKELCIPCVLHLQGLINLCAPIVLTPGMSTLNYCFGHGIKDAYSRYQYLKYMEKSCLRELAIINSVDNVIGRTSWDRHAISIFKPEVRYFWGGELLRSCFYEYKERTLPLKPVIISTISNATYKGFDVILKIAEILKSKMQLDFEWKVYGNIDPTFIERLVGIKSNMVNVMLCGIVTAEQLRDSLINATVYCHPSYIENSPNSLAEAQMLGLPIVATNVGGISSMVEHDKNGYLFPVTDPYVAAYYIKKLLEDRELNVKLGKAGHVVAENRHDKETIVNGLIDIYNKVIENTKPLV